MDKVFRTQCRRVDPNEGLLIESDGIAEIIRLHSVGREG